MSFTAKPRDFAKQVEDKVSEIIDVHPSKDFPDVTYKRIRRA
jgi:hypothetical protein